MAIASVRLRHAPDLDALRAAVADVAARHEVLRTVIDDSSADNPADGVPVQRILDLDMIGEIVEAGTLPAGRTVAEEVITRSREFLTRPFDLRSAPPIRVGVDEITRDAADLGDTEPADTDVDDTDFDYTDFDDTGAVLTIAMHHIATDEWSDRPLLADLTMAYSARRAGRAPDFEPLPVQYADYALWNRRRLDDIADDQLSYWTHALADLPEELPLPRDRARRPGTPGPAATETIVLGPDLRGRLAGIARNAGASMFMLMQAAVAVTLHRVGAGDDIPLGSPISGRTDPALDDLIGFFVGTQVLRTDISGRPRFDELLSRVREADLAAFDNADVGFQQIVERIAPPRVAGRNPLFQVTVGYLPLDVVPGEFLGIPATFEPLTAAAAKFDLAFTAVDVTATGELTIALEYATDLFDRATAQRLLAYLTRVMDAVAADPRIGVDAIDLLDADKIDALRQLESGPPAATGAETTLVDLLDAAIAAHPDVVALRDTTGATLTYREFDSATGRLAMRLHENGVGPDDVVAVATERGIGLLVAVHGVLRAGAAYLPVDVDLPADRIAFMLADSGAVAVVSDASGVEMPWCPADLTLIDLEGEDVFGGGPVPDVGIVPRPAAGNAAYVVYTSGSTGRPKGVVVDHRSVVNVLTWRQATMPGDPFGPGDTVLVKTPVGFDGAVWELVLPFVCGATALVAEPGVHRDPVRQAQIIAEFGVTTAVFVPSLLDLFVPMMAGDGSLRRIIAGGEALTADLAHRVLTAAPHLALINAYGPTETTVVVTDQLAAPDTAGPTVPIGRPIAATTLLVLDGSLRRVPDGAVGELYVRGDALARGYLGRSGLTAAAFIADPTGEVPGARVYRTGDVVRRRDGLLEYVGRADSQVKLRGNRVEIGEIEAAIRDLAVVDGAAVAATGDRLVAWVIPADPAADPGRLVPTIIEQLTGRLPDYMIPAPITVLAEFPLNHTGKLDRRALPMPVLGADTGTAARTELEADLAEIFGVVLSAPVHDVDADFFALGGHSLLGIKAINLIRATLGYEVGLRTLFDRPTVAGLAAHLSGGDGTQPDTQPAAQLTRRADRRAVLSFGQERMLTLHAVNGPSSTYNVPLLWRPGGVGALGGEPIDHEVLRAAVHDVVMRHEVLRTRYPDAAPLVVADPVVPVDIVPGTEALFASAAYAFDLADELPIRVAATGDLAVVTIHHIATDEWSAAPLRADLDRAYTARQAGRVPDWQPLALQYSDFAAWQRETISGARRDAQLAFWRAALTGAPEELTLPYDRPRPPRPSGRGDGVFLALDPDLVDRLRQLGAATGTSMFMVVQGAVAVLLARLGGGPDIPLGTPVTVRNDARLDELVGFFLNTVVLRTDTSGNPTARELLGRVRDTDLAAFDHRDVPFEQVVDEVTSARSSALNPLFQTMVVYVDGRLPAITEGSGPLAPTTAKFDLSFDFTEDASDGRVRVGGVIEYSTDLFDRPTIEAMATRLVAILEYMASRPDSPLGGLDIRTPAELRELHRPAAPASTFAALFDAVVLRGPDAPALRGVDGRRTFAELDARVRLIASRLADDGIGPEDAVAICLPRGIVALEAIFGVLYSGAACLPIEPGTPGDRVAAMCRVAAPRRVIDRLDDPILAPGAPVPNTVRRTVSLRPDHPAYVIFTSGSTGTPKGVVVSHRGLANLFASHRRMLHDPAKRRAGRERLRVGHAWSLAFDASWQPQLWLLDGHEISIVDEDTRRDADALAARLREERWDFLELTPSHLRQLGGAEQSMAAIGFGGGGHSGRPVAGTGRATGQRRLQPLRAHRGDRRCSRRAGIRRRSPDRRAPGRRSARLCSRRRIAAGTRRCGWRTLPGRCRAGPRLSGSRRPDRGTLRGRSVRRGRDPDVPDRRHGSLDAGRAARLPRPRRRSGQDPRVPRRTG